jgi:phage repressor protein C with HTH and peptisase S24 domain
MDTMASRIDEKMKKLELTQEALANKVGISQTMISKLLRGESKSSKHLVKVAQALGVTAEWLEFGTAYPSDSSHSADLDPFMLAEAGRSYGMTERKREIPVVGTTQAGPDRHWEDLGYPTGWGEEYAVIESDDHHAYILRVEGDSMSPRINEGDYVLVEPSTEAQPGDVIVTKLTSGEVMLKYFRADYGEEIMLESHNHGFTTKTIRKTEIVFIHSISGILFRRKIKKRI